MTDPVLEAARKLNTSTPTRDDLLSVDEQRELAACYAKCSCERCVTRHSLIGKSLRIVEQQTIALQQIKAAANNVAAGVTGVEVLLDVIRRGTP